MQREMSSDKEKIMNDKPSGHSSQRLIRELEINPPKLAGNCYKDSSDGKLKFKDNFEGPYKDYAPPGKRTPVVGEKIWGDPPYLPSYVDPMYKKETPSGQSDCLYIRGPFYKGVSETHTEYVNRGVLPGRQFHKYVRHYEEPGMKYERSVTHTDFQPPLPMLPRDKAPCLMEDKEKSWYQTEPKEPKNPHAKEHEMKPLQPEVVYIDYGYKRDFSTEHNDKYVCFQENKKGSKILDAVPIVKERFLENIRDAHQDCGHPSLSSNECDESCNVRQLCPGSTPQKTSWLFQPKNYAFQNGVMLIPCKCRIDKTQDL